jgi:hypothetical protein
MDRDWADRETKTFRNNKACCRGPPATTHFRPWHFLNSGSSVFSHCHNCIHEATRVLLAWGGDVFVQEEGSCFRLECLTPDITRWLKPRCEPKDDDEEPRPQNKRCWSSLSAALLFSKCVLFFAVSCFELLCLFSIDECYAQILSGHFKKWI